MRFYSCILVVSLLYCIMRCDALAWNDCGAPLSRVMTFQDVTVFPDPPSSQDQISLSVQATVLSTVTDANTWVYITKDGVLYLNTTSRTLCDILSTTQQIITCPIAPGIYSYAYVYPLPSLPQGVYTVKIITTANDDTQIGCLSASIQVNDPTQLAGDCSYNSWLKMSLGSTEIQYKNNGVNDQNVGDWVQIGPFGNNAGSAAASFTWGSFVGYQGTSDIIDTGIDLSLYVWGLNGTLNSTAPSGDATLETFLGDFYIGYLAFPNAPVAQTETLSRGTFQLTLNYQAGRTPREQFIVNGSVVFNPQYSQPDGFFYPLVFGTLNPFTLSQTSNGAITAYGAKSWCTCPIDVCNVCGGDGSTCGSSPIAVNTGTTGGLGVFDKAAIGVGVGGGILGIILIAFFAYQIWKRGREARSVRDDSDLAGPDKPDYGSMAINEVLADHGRPLL